MQVIIGKSKRRVWAVKLLTLLLFPFPFLRRTLRRILADRQWSRALPAHIFRSWRRYKKQPHEFRRYLSIALCVKDEAAYICEWLEYHLLQGVEHFYIYNNNGSDNTYELLFPYVKQGLVTWIEYPGDNKQVEIYDDAVRRAAGDTRWLCFIDVDEFILPLKHASFADFLREKEAYSQVVMYWLLYGSAGQKVQEEGLVIERFRCHAERPSGHVKAVFNPRAVICTHIHRSHVWGSTVDENGTDVDRHSPPPSIDTIRVNHYSVKSWQEFCCKKRRGHGFHVGGSMEIHDEYFRWFDRNEVEDPPHLMADYAKHIRQALAARDAAQAPSADS